MAVGAAVGGALDRCGSPAAFQWARSAVVAAGTLSAACAACMVGMQVNGPCGGAGLGLARAYLACVLACCCLLTCLLASGFELCWIDTVPACPPPKPWKTHILTLPCAPSPLSQALQQVKASVRTKCTKRDVACVAVAAVGFAAHTAMLVAVTGGRPCSRRGTGSQHMLLFVLSPRASACCARRRPYCRGTASHAAARPGYCFGPRLRFLDPCPLLHAPLPPLLQSTGSAASPAPTFSPMPAARHGATAMWCTAASTTLSTGSSGARWRRPCTGRAAPPAS